MSLLHWVNQKVNKLQKATSKRLGNLEEDTHQLKTLNINREEIITETMFRELGVISPNAANRMLKVEFYGNTLVNLASPNGNFKNDSDDDGVADLWIPYLSENTTSSNYRIGNKGGQELKSNTSGSSYSSKISRTFEVEVGAYYLIAFDFKALDDGVEGRYQINENGSTVIYQPDITTSGLKVEKITPNSNELEFAFYNDTTDADNLWAHFNNLRLIKITQETYDKIGVSLTDEDIERLFPYVDSVQHVKNPVLSVEGSNIAPTSPSSWEQGSLSTTNGGEQTATNRLITDFVEVVKGRDYRFSVKDGYYNIVFLYDENKNFLERIELNNTINNPNAKYFRLWVKFNDDSEITSDEILNIQPMLNLGTTAKPFVPRNPSYLYAETTLAGNDNKKDILGYNESKGVHEKTKHFETGEELEVNSSESTLAKTPVDGTVVVEDRSNGDIITDFTQSGTTLTWNTIPNDPVATYQLETPEIETITEIYGTPVAAHSHIRFDNQLGKLDNYSDGIVENGTFSEILYVAKVDEDTGVETDVTDSCTLNAERNGFTSTELQNGDLVWYELEVDDTTTAIGEVKYSYYDSRYVIEDDTNGKVYSWDITASDGTPSIQLKEI